MGSEMGEAWLVKKKKGIRRQSRKDVEKTN